MNTKKIILSILGLLIIGGGAFYYFISQQEKDLQEYVSSIETKNEMQKVEDTKVVANKKTFTLAQVAEHNRKEDCWMVINSSVIDVTGFVSKHPGGDKILKGCGIDATGYFNKVGGHMSGIAEKLLKTLEIGKLAQ